MMTKTAHTILDEASLNSFTVLTRVIFTSAAEGEGGYVFTPVCLSVCLSVCLCAGYLKKLWTDLVETWWTR